MTSAAIDDVIDRWAAAERAGDADALNRLIADDFLFAGPAGFVLDKDQWLERFRADLLHYRRFAIEDTRSRSYGDITVVVGVQDQEGDYQGRPVDGRFRLTLIVSTAADGLRIVGLHLSPVMRPAAPQEGE